MADTFRATMLDYVARFNDGNFRGLVDLFTEDARQEDPVGSPPNVGHDAIRQFFVNVEAVGRPQITVLQEPIIIGNEGVMCFSVATVIGEQTVTVPFIVDLMMFADDGRITSLRAFFDAAAMVVA